MHCQSFLITLLAYLFPTSLSLSLPRFQKNSRSVKYPAPFALSVPRFQSARSPPLFSVATNPKVGEPALDATTPNRKTTSGREGLRYRSSDWYHNLLSLPKSFVLRRIWTQLMVNVLMTTVVTVAFKNGAPISIPMLGHELLGGFLGLLLVFRQNTAYDRFWESRVMWSEMSATVRTMAVTIVSHIRPKAPLAAEELVAHTAAFPDALAYTCLSRACPLAHNVKKLVLPGVDQTAQIEPAIVLCFRINDFLNQAIQEMGANRDPLDNFYVYDMSLQVTKLQGCLKACERLLNTPVPWSYSRHASRFLSVYMLTLPFAAVPKLGWLTIPVLAVACWCLLGIEEIGHLIEQPFVGTRNSKRARMTNPYDIGLPVFLLSNQARLDVESIAVLQPTMTQSPLT
jgi:putative membrane protein